MTTRAQPAKRKAEPSDNVAGPKKLRRPIAEGPIVRPNTIKVLVGRPPQTFTVEKHILLKSSQFFKSTLDAPSKKIPPKEIKLDNAARSFEIYLKWLYSGYFYIVEEKDNGGTDNAYMKWEECYGLGHDLQDWGFKDACIDLAQEMVISGNHHFNDLAYPIYTTSPAPQAHKTFAIHLAAHLWWDSDFRIIPDVESPVEWLMDLIAYMGPKMRRSELTGTEKADEFFKNVGCKYHAHGPNTPCYKKTNVPYEEVKDRI